LPKPADDYRWMRERQAELARTIYIRCIHGIFGRDFTTYTVIYGEYIRFWPTLGKHDLQCMFVVVPVLLMV
jgi:hypothetical protein